jgi:hypothetical protein
VDTAGYVYALDLTGVHPPDPRSARRCGWCRHPAGADLGTGGRDRVRGRQHGHELPVIPHQPFWFLLIIALDAAVIWALSTSARPDVLAVQR